MCAPYSEYALMHLFVRVLLETSHFVNFPMINSRAKQVSELIKHNPTALPLDPSKSKFQLGTTAGIICLRLKSHALLVLNRCFALAL